jgi:subtilisin-like proprotein convertase family protein
VQVSDSNPVRDIQVSVNIEHSFLGDVEIILKPPTGQPILLQGRTLGAATQLQATYSLQNTPGLKQVINQPAFGLWQLTVVDYVQMDEGTLKSWQLTLGV